MFRRGKVVLFFASFFTLMVFVFMACQKDFQETTIPLKTSDGSEVQSAKIWFENYQKSTAIDDLSKFKNGQPDWGNAIAVGNAVEVPFRIDGNFNVPSLYNNLTHLGKERLVIYDQGSKGKVAYIIDYMPSETFSSKINDVNVKNFRGKKFDGIIAAYTLNDKNIGGFVWDKGKLVKKYLTKPADISLRSCHTITYSYACGTVSAGGISGSPQCSTGSVTICWSDTDPYNPWLWNETIDEGGGSWDIDAVCRYAPWLPECSIGSGGSGNNFIPVTNMCVQSIKDGIATNRTTYLGDWSNFTTSHPQFLQTRIHAFSAVFTDLQTTGPSRLDIPILEITILCPFDRKFTPDNLNAISIRIASAYNTANLNSTASGSTASDIFMNEWAAEFNKNISGSSSNNQYYMQGISSGQIITNIANYAGTPVRNTGGNCQ